MCVARTAARRRRQMRQDRRYLKTNRKMPGNLSGRAKLAFQNSLTRTGKVST